MIRSFIAIDLEDEKTKEKINSFSNRLKKNQNRMRQVEPQNLHMTLKFLGDIKESMAPKIYHLLKEEINDKLFRNKDLQFQLKGAGQFRKFSIIWVKLIGNTQFLQKIKDTIEDLLFNELNIQREKRKDFKPHLTIGRLKSDRINYKTFDSFKRLINESKNLDFGVFNICQIKLKKSELTQKGPIYSDLIY